MTRQIQPASPGGVAPGSSSRPATGTRAPGGLSFWLFLIVVPGGLVVLAVGLLVASLGVVLCWPGLRRLTAVLADRADPAAHRSAAQRGIARPGAARLAAGIVSHLAGPAGPAGLEVH